MTDPRILPGNNRRPLPVIGCRHEPQQLRAAADVTLMQAGDAGVNVKVKLVCGACGHKFVFCALPFNEQTAMVFRAPVLSVIARPADGAQE